MFFVLILLIFFNCSISFQLNTFCNEKSIIWNENFKLIKTEFCKIKIFSLVLVSTLCLFPLENYSAPPTIARFEDLNRLKLGLREVDYLLSHWDEKTTYCNFGEFQRELLLNKNRERLFKAASELSILDYDKSKTMNVMCRKDPEVVRAFLGLTPQNLLLNKAEKLMKAQSTLDLVDSDRFEEYITAVESYTQAVAEVDSLAYEARTDYSSTETGSKGDNSNIYYEKDNYLSKSKISFQNARDSLAFIVNELKLQ